MALLEYPIIHRYHHDTGNPERNGTRNYCIDLIDYKHALVGMLLYIFEVVLGRIPTEKNWRKGNREWQNPNIAEHKNDSFLI
jgi:hypothetical protein